MPSPCVFSADTDLRAPGPGHNRRMPTRRRRSSGSGVVVGILGLLTAAVLVAHSAIPDAGGYVSLLETFLPWLWVAIAVLLLAALIIRRSGFAWIGTLIAAAVWLVLFVPTLLPHHGTGQASLRVVSENIDADNRDPQATLDSLLTGGADVVALQELDGRSRPLAEHTLASAYPHSYVVGTIGLWSKTALSEVEPLELGLGWNRALSVLVSTPAGPVRVVEVHMASVRPGEYRQRDTMLSSLAGVLSEDRDPRAIVVGDFNSASTDREFQQLETTVSESATTTFGFGYTWPASFPFARVDHVLSRGFSTVSSTVLPDNGSDHRAIDVALR
jgi:vancomycin resistance protein VanJ